MSVYKNLDHGQQSVSSAGTAEALSTSSDLSVGSGAEVAIRANDDNTGSIYVGGSDVDSSNGFVLSAGESVALQVADVSDVYIDADTTGEGVSWITEVA